MSCFDHISFPACDGVLLHIEKQKKTTSGLTWDDTKLWPRCDMYMCPLFCFFTLLAPTIKLWATLAMKPSTWTPRSLHKIRRKGKTKELNNCRIQIMPLIKCYPAVKCTSTDAGSNQIYWEGQKIVPLWKISLARTTIIREGQTKIHNLICNKWKL